MQTVGRHVDGLEIFLGINPYAINLLNALHIFHSVFKKDACGDMYDRFLTYAARHKLKVPPLVAVEHLPDEAEAGGHPQAEAGVDSLRRHSPRALRGRGLVLAVGLAAHEVAAGDDVVHRAYHFHVGVEVDAAMLVQDPEAGVVAHEGILPLRVGLGRVGDGVHVEVVLVPLPYLIVRQVSPPRGDAPARQLRERRAPEPAVMDYLGYHCLVLICSICPASLAGACANTCPFALQKVRFRLAKGMVWGRERYGLATEGQTNTLSR